MNKKKANLKNDILKLLKKEKLAVLATKGVPYPYTTLVGFSFTKDLNLVLFATMRGTRKYSNIVSNPHVSLLIDTRKNYIDDFEDAVALTILGKAAEIKRSDKNRHMKMYLKRFPHLKNFMDDPETALVGIRVNKYIFVRRFQEVKELSIR